MPVSTAADVDCFIVATVTPDYYFPATACLVALRLGVKDKPAFDIAIACSGFIYGLTVGSGLIRSGVYGRVMLIGAESLSKILDKDRSLDGDSCSATAPARSSSSVPTEDSFLSSDLGADGSRPECSTPHGSGSREPIDHAALDAKTAPHPHGRSRNVQTRGEQNGRIDRRRVGEGQPHESRRGVSRAASSEQTHHRRDRALPRSARRKSRREHLASTATPRRPRFRSRSPKPCTPGRLHPGDVVVFVAFGGGLSWGAVAWKWAA